MCDSAPRIIWVCSSDPGIIIATSTHKERIDKRTDNTDLEVGTETDNGNGHGNEEYSCCGKVFGTLRGFRIHQGKVCRKRRKTQQRRPSGRQTRGKNLQESNHSRVHSTAEFEMPGKEVGEKKPKIKWPKANETASYKEFDDEVAKMVSHLSGTTERKLERLAEVIYSEGERRFGMQQQQVQTVQPISGPSRRDRRISQVKREKKALRTRWIRAPDGEKEGLLKIYGELKKELRNLVRVRRRAARKKERLKCRETFVKDPYKFAKGLFTEARSGNLECGKDELEAHLKETYSDDKRCDELPDIADLRKPTAPGVGFNLEDIQKKEVDEFIKKARGKGSPGNDGVSYKVYKYCPKLRLRLYLLLRDSWREKNVAERWSVAEGVYLPKEVDSKELNQFRPISLLNIDGKIIFGILANRIIKFVQENGYIDTTAQKAGVPGIPGCIEHAYSIWEAIQRCKDEKSDLSVVWLDLANAYGSVPHALILKSMEFFWIPKAVQNFILQYYNQFCMRFTTKEFTTNWQRLEVGIAAGCTVSVVLFVLVMEMLLRSTQCENTRVRAPMKAFMDDIAIVSKRTSATEEILKRLDDLISWSRMRFKAKKSRSATFEKGRQKEMVYSIGGERIPTVKEMPVKSLGRWYKDNLSDKSCGKEVQGIAEDGLKAIDATHLPGKFKCWILQHGLYPRLLWPLQMYEIALTRVERIEQRCSVFIRKWLGLPKMLNTTAIYGKKGLLDLPISSIVEEYKAGKARTVMTLRFSKDEVIRDDPPEVRTGRKWKAEEAVDLAIANLQHSDVVGAVQESRLGLGSVAFKPFSTSNRREQREAVVAEVRKGEREKRKLHLVQCSQQGQCLRWEELVVNRKIAWKELWAWQPARTAFLIKSTYDVLPSPANLVRWKISESPLCKCGERGTMRHILSNCKLALNRYTWRHNQILRELDTAFRQKLTQVNEGKLPKMEKVEKVAFHKEGKRNQFVPKGKKLISDLRWEGTWKIAADLDSMLVFPLVTTAQRPDLVIWNEERKMGILMELTVPWEENIADAEHRKELRYEDLLEECKDGGWCVEYYHLAIGARGFVERKFATLLRSRFRFTRAETRKLVNTVQEIAERSSFFIWLKRDDEAWFES